ncbi:MAG: GIY-YIG nuclease family protein [Candidatus Lloydbacteria bacterium]|nr:GIY-YIG nuclease family protein [Candidatus Lloydbacteria bacterium]
MAYVYILKSEKFPKTYVGSTTDLERRLKEHNSGKHNYTSKFLPWIIIHSEEYSLLAEARKREKYLKSAVGRKYIKKNICIPR